MKFKYEHLNMGITVKKFTGSRQRDLNPGVEITVVPGNVTYQIACENYINGNVEQSPLQYQRVYSKQAIQVNKLIELIERIQNYGDTVELITLEEMKICIKNTLVNSSSWANESNNPYHFFIPGKRIHLNTFKLVDAIPEEIPELPYQFIDLNAFEISEEIPKATYKSIDLNAFKLADASFEEMPELVSSDEQPELEIVEHQKKGEEEYYGFKSGF